MKRLYTSSSKVILSIVFILFTAIFLAGTMLAAFLGGWGLYSTDGNGDFKRTIYNKAGNDYAAWIMSEEDSDFKSDKLDTFNCYYGVMEGKHSKDSILNGKATYIYKNFNNVSVPKDAYFNQYWIDKNTTFSLSENFLNPFSTNIIHNNSNEIYQVYGIQGIGYDIVSQKAYVYANDRFYLINSCYYDYRQDNDVDGTPNTNNIYAKMWEHNASSQEEPDTNALYIAGTPYQPLSESATRYVLRLDCDNGSEGVLCLDNVADLTDIHSQLRDIDDEVSLEDISSVGRYENNPNTKYYTFVCFPNETRLSSNSYTNDFYSQAKSFINVAYSLRYLLLAVIIISFIIAMVSYILFLCAAGHKNDEKAIVAGWVEQIPTDLILAVVLCVEFTILALTVDGLFYVIRQAPVVGIILTIIAYVVACIIGLLWSSNVAVNIKLHQFWKNTLMVRGFKFLKKPLATFHEETKGIRSSVKWVNRIWIVFFLITFIELIFMATGAGLIIIIEKIILGIMLHKLLKSYARIKETAVSLAAGDTSAQVDLTDMPLFLEEHGRALNEIQSGITVALEERTKSERMKTELITNVSHDIKTPLTSIINYVDLLQKEDIDNTRAQEYLEVLSRQSSRLKKLIEDLIEASKVSTGNINFNIEKVNAIVLLNQSIGEFSDRLEASKIGVVTNLPSKDIYLNADNRYLWRVFDNLMSNIVKYAQPGTRAYIDLMEEGNSLLFVFRNTSKEALNISADELMERFVRGDKSRYTDGNGLGLSIARSLAEAMGGKLDLAIDGDFFKATVYFPKA